MCLAHGAFLDTFAPTFASWEEEMAGFHPRRLGHVNLWVADLEASVAFYEQVCGIRLVRRERDLVAGFHSNGNTHHDIGLIETSKGMDRIGRDGRIQIPKTRGVTAGLNHLGWEMENEAQLVEAYRHLPMPQLQSRLADHLISHSVYVTDPDGNAHEFYADAIPDWRTIFNLEHDDLVTAEWNPLASAPSEERHYPVEPELGRVDGAPLRPLLITGATLATQRFGEMRNFLAEIAGLSLVEEAADRAVFAGGCGRPDLTLARVAPGARTGLLLSSFQLDANSDLDAAEHLIARLQRPVLRRINDDRRQSIVLGDPDGFQVEFYVSKTGGALEPLALAS